MASSSAARFGALPPFRTVAASNSTQCAARYEARVSLPVDGCYATNNTLPTPTGGVRIEDTKHLFYMGAIHLAVEVARPGTW